MDEAPQLQHEAPAQPAPFRVAPPAIFNGDRKEADVWLYQFNSFIAANNIQGMAIFHHFVSRLGGDALRWFMGLNPIPENWQGLQLAFNNRFVTTTATNDRQRWAQLRQTNSLDEYVSEFCSLAARIADSSEGEKIQRFIEGLKSRNNQQQVLLQNPQSDCGFWSRTCC